MGRRRLTRGPRFQTCTGAVNNINAGVDHIEHELAKYDPVTDAAGGPVRSPRGHYIEIRQEQNRVKNNMEKFAKNNCFDFYSITDAGADSINAAMKERATDPSIDQHLLTTYPQFF